MLLGLVRPTSGTAEVLGHSISHPGEYLSQVGALIEGPTFYPGMSGRANLSVLSTLGHGDAKRIPHVLDLVGLVERANDPFRTYSLGMKQRLGIAAALLRDPQMLFLDEPTNGLDPAGIHEMSALVRQLANDGPTVFLSSHLLAEIQNVCDWLVMVKKGQLIYQGPIDELLRSADHAFDVGTADPADLLTVARLVADAGFQSEPQVGLLRVHAPEDFVGELSRSSFQAGLVLTEITPVQGNLEDRFLELTKDVK
jgi:ABC-2 type transport system ATP-binding protein